MRKTPIKRKSSIRSKKGLKHSGFVKSVGKKPKKESLSKLKKKLWEVFSKYIRVRDKFTCFTCGRVGTGGGIHAGHFIPKSVSGLSLYFSEEAVNAQCYHCNINLSGNWLAYEEAMIRKHGKERTEELKREARGIKREYTSEEYAQLIEHYQKKII